MNSMFQLDEQFLKDLGLDQLPDDQKQAFLDHIYSERSELPAAKAKCTSGF
jgi:hypothetical protein